MYSLCIWDQITRLELKDAVALGGLIVAIAALVTSYSVFRLNKASTERQKLENERKEFAESIMGVVQIRQKFQELRRELGDRYDDISSFSQRIALGDQRQFHLSKALQIADGGRIETSDFENVLLAAALIDAGRVGLSLKYYRRAYDTAPDKFGKATAQRVYGRALVTSGDYEEGRKQMLDAANAFKSLASDSSYVGDQMLAQCAETYRRLVLTEIGKVKTSIVRQDTDVMKSVIDQIKDQASGDARLLRSGLREIEQIIQRSEPIDTAETSANPGAALSPGATFEGN